MPRRSSKKFVLHLLISMYLIFQLALNLRLLMHGTDMYSCQIRYMNQRQFVIYVTYFHSRNCNVTLLPFYENTNVTNDTYVQDTIDKIETTSEKKINLTIREEPFQEDYAELDGSEENDETEELEETDENESFDEMEKITDSTVSKMSTVTNFFAFESSKSLYISNNTEGFQRTTITEKPFFVKTQNTKTLKNNSEAHNLNDTHTTTSHPHSSKNINASTKKVSVLHTPRLLVASKNYFINKANQRIELDDDNDDDDDDETELADLNVRLVLSNKDHMINVYVLMTTVQWPRQAKAYFRTYSFIQAYYLFVSLCLILTFSFLLLVLFYGVKFDDPLCFYVVFIFLILLGVLLIMDLVAVIIYAIDNDKTFNFIGWLKFVGVRNITSEIASFSSKIRRSYFTSPARWMTLIACRFVLMWFANAFIFSYFLYKVVAVITDEDYEDSSASEGTTATSGGYSLRSH